MKKMTALLVVLTVFAVCALLVLRQQRRAEPAHAARPAEFTATQLPKPAEPMDGFQAGVKLDNRTGTTPDAEAKRRLMERLQREEERQKPSKQRN